MRPPLFALLAGLSILLPSSTSARCSSGGKCGCSKACAYEKTAATLAKPETGHPLKGVVVAVLAGRGQLIVKHEAIPGVMHAMTMGFHVDEPTLKTARKGAVVAATLVQRDGQFWLVDTKFVSANGK